MPRSERRRVFLAVWPTTEVAQAIEDAVSKAKSMASGDPSTASAIRWLKRETWHLTVVFVGSVDAGGLEDVRGAASRAACTSSAFDVEFKGAGAFPGLRRPKVLWVGLGAGGEAWNQLVSRTRDAVSRVVPLRREKDHMAHLTVARVSRPVDVGGIVDTLGRIDSVTMRVSKLSLIESVLEPKGARYTTIEEYYLAG